MHAIDVALPQILAQCVEAYMMKKEYDGMHPQKSVPADGLGH